VIQQEAFAAESSRAVAFNELVNGDDFEERHPLIARDGQVRPESSLVIDLVQFTNEPALTAGPHHHRIKCQLEVREELT
jgi:hypothetical protein